MAGAAALGLGLLSGALNVRANDDPVVSGAPVVFVADGPAGQQGWTVQLQTLPKGRDGPGRRRPGEGCGDGAGGAGRRRARLRPVSRARARPVRGRFRRRGLRQAANDALEALKTNRRAARLQ
jgi:hypothetical protein